MPSSPSVGAPERVVEPSPAAPRPRHSEIAEPWTKPWWWCARGEWATFGWIVLLHGSLLLAPFVTERPSAGLLLTALGLCALGGLGTTVAFHRALAHGAAKLHWLVETPLILFAVMNGSGKPLTWVANHRLHHAVSDTDEDISAPSRGGFWWAHLRWLWQAGQAPIERYCGKLDCRRYRIWTQLQVPLLAISFFGGLLISPTAWFWLGPARLLLGLHLQCTINSISHLGDARSAGGSSQNVAWLAPFHFLQGENWHRNHHDDPADARIGRTRWQVDFGWWTIALFRALGLATDVQRSRSAVRGGTAR
ncbi:MAG: hypothetical protein FJ293_10625 [Planctomycetes bacterium]|nr:hypothetical protein [Planctomycetota bacterium]